MFEEYRPFNPEGSGDGQDEDKRPTIELEISDYSKKEEVKEEPSQEPASLEQPAAPVKEETEEKGIEEKGIIEKAKEIIRRIVGTQKW